MGKIEFEGWGVKIDNLDALNHSPEISRIGLHFEDHGNVIYAASEGNVSGYYLILLEVKARILSGAFLMKVTLSNKEIKNIQISNSYVIENDEIITELIH